MIKQTKIVATLGPASTTVETLSAMIHAGMNVARINFSHGDHDEHGERIDNARAAAEATGQPLAILQDLCGPKIRIGDFPEGAIELKKGDVFTITARAGEGSQSIVSVNYPMLPREVAVGMQIMLEDGRFILSVTAIEGDDIITEVVAGGHIRSRRGVNIPGAMLSIGAITPKDKKDLAFGIEKKVDIVALSFVQTEKDITDLRAMLASAGHDALIVAKIETQQAIDNLDSIIAATDGIMIARGDLAVEVPKEDVPLHQKMIIAKCRALGKPVITATQMLDSMTESPVPTRAEVADVANAVFDGTDAVMLSQESAVGNDPVHVVRTMAEIAVRAESSEVYKTAMKDRQYMEKANVTDTTTLSATNAAHQLEAKAILVLTESGFSARMLSRFRPHTMLVAVTPHAHVARQINLSFGVFPFVHTEPITGFHQAITAANTILTDAEFATKGDVFILVAGTPFGISGTTNTCSIQTIV